VIIVLLVRPLKEYFTKELPTINIVKPVGKQSTAHEPVKRLIGQTTSWRAEKNVLKHQNSQSD